MSRASAPGSVSPPQSATPSVCAVTSADARFTMGPLGRWRPAGVEPGAGPGSRSEESGGGPGAAGREARAR
jgi:hypothetical protein